MQINSKTIGLMISAVVIGMSGGILLTMAVKGKDATIKYLLGGKTAVSKTSKSSSSTSSDNTSSKEYDCDWQSELMSRGAAYRCANSSGCPYGCYRGRWRRYGHSSPKECAKASVACLNKRCGHLCK